MIQSEKSHNLERRTSQFGLDVIRLCRLVREDTITRPIISQLVRSATSIGANYMEANGASSKRDFVNKIFICKKESQETKHWFTMLSECVPNQQAQIQSLWQEVHELNLIFQKIITTSKKNN